ncbi:cytochrome P450 2L1-like isoform X1 [Oratosquilla oratoria]|uniref:cytochrome P450 2L1-like isoform X1 n=1 Tax=Oratosquilla oratoria TaxID=337810 RepID=UPI003F7726A1
MWPKAHSCLYLSEVLQFIHTHPFQRNLYLPLSKHCSHRKMLAEVLLSVFFLTVCVYFLDAKPKNLPPGLWGLPVVGYIFSMLPFPEQIKNLQRRFGNIASWRIGSRITILISDFTTIKSALGHPNIAGRADFFSFNIFSHFENMGIIISNGSQWQHARRFALRNLKDFGMGKASLENIIIPEVNQLINEICKQEGKPMEISNALNVSILNIIWKLVADRRYNINDEELLTFQNMIHEDFENVQGPVMLLDYFPWLLHILPSWVINKVMRVNIMEYNRNTFNVFHKQIVEEHKKSRIPHNPRDYIDAYLDQEEKHDPNFSFKLELLDLLITIRDLFVAGSETSSSTFRWMIAFMAVYPDVQTKVQAEIDAVVPRDRVPNLNDRMNLQYLEAMLNEVHRHASFVPLGVPHLVTEDTDLEGYVLPKGSIVLANIFSCHFDPCYWKYPEKFYPEHFIDEKGKCMTKREGFLPFSVGRHVCPGETLARMELFLFTSAVLQQFTVKSPPGEKIIAETDPSKLLFHHVKPYKVVFERRTQIIQS